MNTASFRPIRPHEDEKSLGKKFLWGLRAFFVVIKRFWHWLSDKPFSKSFVIHFGILVFLWMTETVTKIFNIQPKPLAPPALRVDLVALPDQLAYESKAPPTMNSTPSDSVDPKPSEPEPLKGSKETLPRAELEEFLGKTDPNPKEVRKSTERSKKENQQKIKNSLAKLRALDRIRAMNESDAQETPTYKGNKISKGKSLSAEAIEQENQGYLEQIRDHIANSWALPRWLLKENLSARIQIWINSDGQIQKRQFLKKSGNGEFDRAVMEALDASDPLPKPDASINETLENRGIILGFPL